MTLFVVFSIIYMCYIFCVFVCFLLSGLFLKLFIADSFLHKITFLQYLISFPQGPNIILFF